MVIVERYVPYKVKASLPKKNGIGRIGAALILLYVRRRYRVAEMVHKRLERITVMR